MDRLHNFVTMQLSDTFVAEYREAMELEREPPTLMVVRKSDEADTFIAKVKVGRVDVARGLGVGTILASWQQDDIRENDCILY